MPARHYWTALLAIVNDRQQSQSRAPARCDRVVPSSLDSTPPFLAHEGINDSVWDNALGAGEIAFDFGAEMWDSIGDYNSLGFEMGSYFDGLDIIPSDNLDTWLAS